MPKTTHPIRILQVVTNLNCGGLETMLMNLYRVIDRDKIQFDFMVHRAEEGAYESEILSLGGHIYRLPPISPRNLPQYMSELKRFFARHPEYRVVHAHLDTLSSLVLRAAKNAGVTCRISHSHSSRHTIDAKLPFKLLSRALLKPYCTHFFACSKVAGDWLFGRQIRTPEKLHVIPNAINIDSFAFSAEKRTEVRNNNGLSEKWVLGHVGNFTYPKNHTLLINFFHTLHQRNPEALLLLVGDGSLRSEMEQKAKSLNLGTAVRFLGTRRDIPDLLPAIDVFVFPSLFEGLPVTVIEAQASGLPCVLSDTITRECDVTGNVRFLPLAAGAEAWAEEIRKLQGVGRLPDAAQKVAAAGYDVRQTAKWLEEFYMQEHEKATTNPH